MDAPRTIPPSPPPATFRAAQRLTRATEYQRVYAARARKSEPPLTVFAAPNGLGRCRLGLSIGRRVGPAVVRNSVKRRLREAFRLSCAGWPQGLDLVVSASPHERLKTDQYAEHLTTCVRQLARVLARRGARAEGDQP